MRDFVTKTIRSWDEFTKLVPKAQVHSWIYRGQSEEKWPLATTIERALGRWEINLKNATSIEFQLIREFRRRLNLPEYARCHNDTLFCLALMQHYGAPTRLLDCTYSPYVAAAFAMEQGVKKVPTIWAFHGRWCEREATRVASTLVKLRNHDAQRDDQTFSELYQLQSSTPEGSSRWKFVKHENPLHLNERLAAQQGGFLCPADLACSFESNLQAMDGWDSDEHIVKFRLDLTVEEARDFVRNLRNMNLNYAAFFPGLDGFARSLGQQIVHYKDLADGGSGGRAP
jgi:hypothetical protein